MNSLGSLILFKTGMPTLDLFTNDLRCRFLEIGYDIYDFDLLKGVESMGLLYDYLGNHKIIAMIGYNSTIFGMKTPSGANVWETLGIPTINILVDHPYWYHSILENTPQNGIIICIDSNHMDYINRFYPNIGASGFMLHGGSTVNTVNTQETDIVYAGSLFTEYINSRKPDDYNWGFDSKKICDDVIDLLLANPNFTIEFGIEKVLSDNRIFLDEDVLRRFISSNVYLERVINSHFREKILSSVAKAGLPITICGNGWNECDWIGLPNVDYIGYVSPLEALNKLSNSKITLNSMPWFKSGVHERIFNAMLNHSVLITETNQLIDEILPDDTCFKFSLEDDLVIKIPEILSYALSSPLILSEVSERAYDFAIANHSWTCRADELHRDLLSSLL